MKIAIIALALALV